jgi:hypothetical protein
MSYEQSGETKTLQAVMHWLPTSAIIWQKFAQRVIEPGYLEKLRSLPTNVLKAMGGLSFSCILELEPS